VLPNLVKTHARLESIRHHQRHGHVGDNIPREHSVEVHLIRMRDGPVVLQPVDHPERYVGDEEESDELTSRLATHLRGCAAASPPRVQDQNGLAGALDEGRERRDYSGNGEDRSVGNFFLRRLLPHYSSLAFVESHEYGSDYLEQEVHKYAALCDEQKQMLELQVALQLAEADVAEGRYAEDRGDGAHAEEHGLPHVHLKQSSQFWKSAEWQSTCRMAISLKCLYPTSSKNIIRLITVTARTRIPVNNPLCA
jgi:hypothetical protein